jgi:glycosyltransferase involved in cell wall biosynthesis
MIVKNEEEALPRCLRSLGAIPDEIVILDTGSTDRTKALAREFTDRVYDFAWIDDFAAARNAAFSLATRDFILWMDADDILREDDRDKLSALKTELDADVDAVSMKYHLAFDADNHVTFSSRLYRLVRRARGFAWHGPVHEYLAVDGNILHADIAVTHSPVGHDVDPSRNLRIYEQRLAAGETFTPRDVFYYANECYDHGRYHRAAEYYRMFLANGSCWVEDAVRAYGRLADCSAHLGDAEAELSYTLQAFTLDIPRADFCCRLGFIWMKRREWQRAVFWYDLATRLGRPASELAFVDEDAVSWLPHVQLCVCYDHLGDYRRAYEHNERAGAHRPNNPYVIHNRAYLESMRGQGPKGCGAPPLAHPG